MTELEKRFLELDERVNEMEGEISFANSVGCSDLVSCTFISEYEDVFDRWNGVLAELVDKWIKDPDSVSEKVGIMISWRYERAKYMDGLFNDMPEWAA